MAPIIDVHAHIFNAMDIPVDGYLQSRRSERKGSTIEYFVNFFPGPQIYTYLAERMRERCVTRKLGVGETGWIYRQLLKLFGMATKEKLKDWEESLTKDVETIASDLVHTWEDIDLYVPLMIDYEYWFKNTLDNKLEDQIKLVRQIVRAHQGRIHPFVPFDPARELVYQVGMNNPDGQLEKYGSLNMVKHAIEEGGFIGVKLYNSLGYRPSNNKKVEDHRMLMAIRNEKMQYLFGGEEYDRVLSDLYRYCEENEVPITTHCGMYGIESYPDASFDFGKAIYWEDVLSQYQGLRLNLAHFGWNQRVRYGGEKNWVKDICRMMTRFDHLYTDVSCHRVTTAQDRQGYISEYKKIIRDFPIIKNRLLFGTDWHVLKRVKNYRKFKDGYLEVLKHKGLFTKSEIDDFLGGNAMNFLGLRRGDRNWQRLKTLYAKKGITPPAWFP